MLFKKLHYFLNLFYRYLQCDLENFDLTELQYHFDVCLIDPPLEEYQRRCPGLTFSWSPWRWDEIIRLNIGQVVAQRGFCFLWCGSAEGLDEGRKCLKAWGKSFLTPQFFGTVVNFLISRIKVKFAFSRLPKF